MSPRQSAGLDAARRRLAVLPERARAEAHAALLRIGAEVLAQARRTLRFRPRPARRDKAVAEPEETLSASLTATLDPDADRLTVSSNSPHARYVEFGTRRMAARPFLRPAVEATRETALDEFRAAAQAAQEQP